MASLRHVLRSFRRGRPKLPLLPAALLKVGAVARVALSPRKLAGLPQALARRCEARSRSGRRLGLYRQKTQPETRRCWRQSPSNFAGYAGRVEGEDVRSAPTVRELQSWHRGSVRRQIRWRPEVQRAGWAGFAGYRA